MGWAATGVPPASIRRFDRLPCHGDVHIHWQFTPPASVQWEVAVQNSNCPVLATLEAGAIPKALYRPYHSLVYD